MCAFSRKFVLSRSWADFKLTKRGAKGSEKARDVFCKTANFGFLPEGQKCREPQKGKAPPPQKKMFACLGKSKRGRRPICGKIDTPKLLNVPPQSRPARSSPRSGCSRSLLWNTGYGFWIHFAPNLEFPPWRFFSVKRTGQNARQRAIKEVPDSF